MRSCSGHGHGRAILRSVILVAALQAGVAIAGAANAPVHIPFVVGLTTVRAVSAPVGDYESVQVVDKIDAHAETSTRSAEAPDDNGKVREITTRRTVSTADQRNSRILRRYFHESDPAEFPGTTPTFSTVMLNDLRATGKTAMTELDVQSEFGMSVIKRTLQGVVTRVGAGPIDMTVLVNGKLEALPAWHVTGRLSDAGDSEDYEYFVLDQPDNPLILRWKGAGASSFVTKIEFPVAAQSTGALEQALQDERHALVYGIYFEFARADIRKVSDRTLNEIAAVLRKHPDWKLSIAGHTDGIGKDTANLDLSRRRAQAVKTALVSRFGIASDRLSTSGFGASQPKDRNDTAEGRARNRRVELTRQ